MSYSHINKIPSRTVAPSLTAFVRTFSSCVASAISIVPETQCQKDVIYLLIVVLIMSTLKYLVVPVVPSDDVHPTFLKVKMENKEITEKDQNSFKKLSI